MDGMQDKISALLNDPASMEKVMSMARALSGGKQDEEKSSEPSSGGAALPALLAQNAPGAGGAIDIMKALSSLDPKIINGVSRLISEYSKPDDERTLLLKALKPYLREERRGKMDQAMNILRLAHTARIALETLGGGK